MPQYGVVVDSFIELGSINIEVDKSSSSSSLFSEFNFLFLSGGLYKRKMNLIFS